MSYIVFALKWRPKNFDEIVGQDHIVTTLANAIQRNRLAHAYLFAGPRGVGKTSTARILARALNCKDGPTDRPCGKCPSCLEIFSGRSLDVIEIDGASNRGIDEIRTLRENVKFSPTIGKFKIYIIDEVHQITTDGFNALLKTLEEPPEFVKFIFATTQPQKVPPTILSRCQRMDFRRISIMEIIQQLERIISAEKVNVDKEVLFAIARASDGSLRDAESTLDQLIAFTKDKVSLQDVVSMLGMVEQTVLFDITDKIIHHDAGAALKLLNDIIDKGKDTGILLANLIEHFRNLMIAKVTGADSRLIDLPQETCERLSEQANLLSLEEIFNGFNVLANTQEMARRLESLRIPLEISLVKLARPEKRQQFRNAVPENPAEEKIPPLKERVLLTPTTSVKKVEEPEQSLEVSSLVSLNQVKELWQTIIQKIGKIKMSVATYLNEGIPAKLEGNVLTVSLPKNHLLHKETLEKKENKAIIENNACELLNTNLKINFVLSKEENKSEGPEEHRSVRSALEMFNGRLIKEE
jgi:DNA polymerase-3 subunit gamma/tau